MSTSLGDASVNVQKSRYSPHLFAYLKCDDGSGYYLTDSSGNGNDFSPLNAPQWQPGQLVTTNRIICDPTSKANNLVWECTTGSGTTTTTGTTTPAFSSNQSNGSTVSDNGIVWTCRSLPNFWGNAGVVTIPTTNNGPTFFPQRFNSLFPMGGHAARDGGPTRSITVSGTFAAADQSLSAASGLDVFTAGDVLYVSGSATTKNNVLRTCATVAAGKITWATGSGLTNSGPETVTISKVCKPLAILITMSASRAGAAGAGPAWFTHRPQWGIGSEFCGFSIPVDYTSGTAAVQLSYRDVANNVATLNPGSLLGTNSTKFVTCLIDRYNGQFSTWLDTTAGGSSPSTIQDLTSWLPPRPTQLQPINLFSSFSGTSTTKFSNIQIYFGNPETIPTMTSALLTQMSGGTPLSASQWP